MARSKNLILVGKQKQYIDAPLKYSELYSTMVDFVDVFDIHSFEIFIVYAQLCYKLFPCPMVKNTHLIRRHDNWAMSPYNN